MCLYDIKLCNYALLSTAESKMNCHFCHPTSSLGRDHSLASLRDHHSKPAPPKICFQHHILNCFAINSVFDLGEEKPHQHGAIFHSCSAFPSNPNITTHPYCSSTNRHALQRAAAAAAAPQRAAGVFFSFGLVKQKPCHDHGV
jgi:hypothetical protein